MPIYNFRCPECGHRFDELLSIEKRDEAVCPKCAARVSRVWSGKCAFGAKRASSPGVDCDACDDCGASGGCGGGCSGNCANCAGCGG